MTLAVDTYPADTEVNMRENMDMDIVFDYCVRGFRAFSVIFEESAHSAIYSYLVFSAFRCVIQLLKY